MQKNKPMIFSTEMVRSLLNGTKTQTRRIIKVNNSLDFMGFEIGNNYRKSHVAFGFKKNSEIKTLVKSKYQIGDTIWVRETFAEKGNRIFYKADSDDFENAGLKGMYDFKWKPSIFMPKGLARIYLKITNVRIERLQEISESDAIAEGIDYSDFFAYKLYQKKPFFSKHISATDSYMSLFEYINGKGTWQENPLVWVYDFEVLSKK